MTINTSTSTDKKEYEPSKVNVDTTMKSTSSDWNNDSTCYRTASKSTTITTSTTTTSSVFEKLSKIGSIINHKLNNIHEIVTIKNVTSSSPLNGNGNSIDCIRPACDDIKSKMKQMEMYRKEIETKQQQQQQSQSQSKNSNDNKDNKNSKTKSETKTNTETKTKTSTNDDDNNNNNTNISTNSSNTKSNPKQQQQKKLQCPATSAILGKSSWTLLHSMAAWYPEKPNTDDIQLISQFFNALARFYPCPYCAQDFQQSIQETPIRATSRTDLCQWLCEQHNTVNDKLGKSTFPCDMKSLDERWRNNPKC